MRPIRLDAETANRLASGQLNPDDAPPGYSAVAQLLAQARTAPTVASGREPATVAAMQAAVLGRLELPTSSAKEKKMLGKVLTLKGAAVAGAVLLGAGTAAAATGSLPSQAQQAVHDALAHLDVSVPSGTGSSNGTDHGQSSDHSGVISNHHALPGLCNAASHNGTTSGTQGTKPDSHSVFGSFSSSTCTGVGMPGNSANAGAGAEPGSQDAGTNSGSGEGHGGKPASVPPGPPTTVSTPAPVPTPDQGSSANPSGSANSGPGLSTANGNDAGASSTGSGAASSGTGNATSRP
jgi:hypothetical protein